MAPVVRKLVAVGDLDSSPRNLLAAFSNGTCSRQEYRIPRFDGGLIAVVVDGKSINLSLWDDLPDSEYDEHRRLVYSNSDVILITYAIDSPDSLESVTKKWISDVSHFWQGTPVILVGCNKDLRDDQRVIDNLSKLNRSPVTTEQGKEVGRLIGAYQFLECSTDTGEGVKQVLEAAARVSLSPRRGKRKGTCILL